jgi:hypothetical protein
MLKKGDVDNNADYYDDVRITVKPQNGVAAK